MLSSKYTEYLYIVYKKSAKFNECRWLTKKFNNDNIFLVKAMTWICPDIQNLQRAFGRCKKAVKRSGYHHTSRHSELCTGRTVISYKSGRGISAIRVEPWGYCAPHPVWGWRCFLFFIGIISPWFSNYYSPYIKLKVKGTDYYG